MKTSIVILIGVTLMGCRGYQRLTNRDNGYDTTPIYLAQLPIEPYATFVGYHYFDDVNYVKLYLIHWKGNSLDNKSLPEDQIENLKIPIV